MPASKASGHVVALCLPLPTGSIERNQVGKGGQTSTTCPLACNGETCPSDVHVNQTGSYLERVPLNKGKHLAMKGKKRAVSQGVPVLQQLGAFLSLLTSQPPPQGPLPSQQSSQASYQPSSQQPSQGSMHASLSFSPQPVTSNTNNALVIKFCVVSPPGRTRLTLFCKVKVYIAINFMRKTCDLHCFGHKFKYITSP